MEILMQAGALTRELNANPKRKAMYSDIVEGLRLIEGSVNMLMSTMVGTQYGILAANDPNSQKTFDAIQKDLGAQKPMLKQLIGRMMPIIMAHTYKTLSDAQMETYKAFVLSPTGRKLYGAIDTATDAVMSKAGIEFGTALIKELQPEP